MKNREPITALVKRLDRYHAKDREERLAHTWRRWIEDPLKPQTDTGGLRINPILVLLVVIALLAGGTFLFFSWVQL
ncbi:MAG TPA: hypothetical protein VGS27_31140 [Candidatus Sulfotelmatobacter sp.]|nr:hypothetical protein [Candidatus Sulfotelmatobacter sp.]